MNSAPLTTLCLLLTTLAACNASDAESTGSGTDTDGATDGDSEPDTVEPGFRLLFPTGEWGIESGYMVVEGGPDGLEAHTLPLPSSVDEGALNRAWPTMSNDARWGHVCFQHEDGTDISALYALAGPKGTEPTLTDLGPQLCAATTLPIFVDSGEAAFFPDASDGLWALALDTDAGTPIHLDTPAGGPAAAFRMRPGTSEVLIYHGDSMWWHPGVPVDVLPRLVADGWLWGTGQGEFFPRFIDSDRVLLWRDGQPLVASLNDGTLRDVIEIPTPNGDGCDDPLYLSGIAEVTGMAEVTGIVCRPDGSAPYVVELQNPAGEPWVLDDGAWDLNLAVPSSDGRRLAFIADHPGAEPGHEDGLYVVDRMTRGTPVFVPGQHPPTRAAFCDEQLFATFDRGLLHAADLDTNGPHLAALETIDASQWDDLDPGRHTSYCLPELRRFILNGRAGIVSIDLDTLEVDVLATTAHADEVLRQVQLAPDRNALTYFRHEPWCEGACPALLSMLDLLDDSTTELQIERMPQSYFPVSIGPLAR